jgi:hypothetical protein
VSVAVTVPADSAFPPTDSWLADGEVLVHIGVHKTGTTALQSALAKARSSLVEQDVHYPGTDTEHFVATNAFLGRSRGAGWSKAMSPPQISKWTKLIKEVNNTNGGRIVLSSEVLCEATPDQIRAFVAEFRGRPLRVIATFRPLESLMPSNWQQYIKAGHTFTFDEWLQATMSEPVEPKKPTPSFWMRNDHPSVLQRWSDVVGSDRVAALVIDPQVRSMLFDTFEDVIGLSRGTLTADTEAVSNRGLSAEEVEYIRQFNVALDRGIDFRHYHLLIRRAGLLQMVEGRRPGDDEHKIELPAWATERARAIGAQHIERLREMGVTVFGELDHLVPDTPIAATEPATASMVPIDAAVRLLFGTFERSVATIEKLQGVSPTTSGVTPVSSVSSTGGLRAWVPPILVPWLKKTRRRAFALRRRLRR